MGLEFRGVILFLPEDRIFVIWARGTMSSLGTGQVVKQKQQLQKQQKQQPVEQRLFDLKDAAAYLGCKLWTVREMIWHGQIDFIRNGKRQFIAREDLDKWIEADKTRYTY